jgi:peptidoglycan/xylan/chitin deacetylase (PgdA/CDA1 family)
MPAKDNVKRTVKSLAGAVGTFLPRRPERSRILTYHSVGRRPHEMNVTPEAFQEQMTWLAENSAPVSLSSAAMGQPGVAVTFDDGYLDNLMEAAPILQEYRIPATVFIVAGKVGAFLDHDIPDDSARLMTWDQIRELEAMGVAIGGHSVSHPRLSTLPESAQRKEIVGCAQLLEERLGHSVEAFAYPYGSATDYDTRCIQLVEDAGYLYACSNRYGWNCAPHIERFALRRIWIDRTDTLDTFRQKVLGQLDLLHFLDSKPALFARRMLNRVSQG